MGRETPARLRPSADQPKTGDRVAGTPNKTTGLLKDAILLAADKAGGKEGIAGYLRAQATANPGPFMALLGKVLPTQVTGDPAAPVVQRIEIVGGLPDMPTGVDDTDSDFSPGSS